MFYIDDQETLEHYEKLRNGQLAALVALVFVFIFSLIIEFFFPNFFQLSISFL